jgi:glycosyltransferase involved in cell wall biosynthesis
MKGLLKESSIARFRKIYVNQSSHWQAKLTDLLDWVLVGEQVVHRSVKTQLCHPINSESCVSLCSVSIILPVYNEQSCIYRTFDAVLDYCQFHPTYTFIFVSDGSTDCTAQILEHRIRQAQTSQIQLLAYDRRGGKGYAVKRGMEVAHGEYLCFLDGDLAYSLEHLDTMIAQLQQFDLVIGCRSLAPGGNRGLKTSRKVAGKVFNTLSSKILNLNFVDMQAGLKGFRKNAARKLFKNQALKGFSFDVELIYLAKKFGYTIAEIPAYVSGSHACKASKVNLLLDSLKMLLDLFKIRLHDFMKRYE